MKNRLSIPEPPPSLLRQLHNDRPRQRRVQPLRDLASGTLVVRNGQRVEKGRRCGSGQQRLYAPTVSCFVSRSSGLTATRPESYGCFQQCTSAVRPLAALRHGQGRNHAGPSVLKTALSGAMVERAGFGAEGISDIRSDRLVIWRRHYGWYGDTTGYSGPHTNSQEVPRARAGAWRVAGFGASRARRREPIQFGVDTSLVPASTRRVAAGP
jgi:hypothetical protein